MSTFYENASAMVRHIYLVHIYILKKMEMQYSKMQKYDTGQWNEKKIQCLETDFRSRASFNFLRMPHDPKDAQKMWNANVTVKTII